MTETVEEYLARGGKITRVEFGVLAKREGPTKSARKEALRQQKLRDRASREASDAIRAEKEAQP